MNQKTLKLSILVPLLIMGITFILDKLNVVSSGDLIYSPAYGFNYMKVIILVCGEFIGLVMIPFLFASLVQTVKKKDSAWKLQLTMIFLIGIIATILTLSMGLVYAFVIIPLNLFVFFISLFISLLKIASVRPRTPFYTLVVLTLLSLIIVILVVFNITHFFANLS